MPLVAIAREPDEPYGPGGGDSAEPPRIELRPYTREAIWRIFRGGEAERDELELRLARGARSRGGLALRIGQGLRALRKERRLMQLGFRFPDHCRELGIGPSRGYELCAFAEALETRDVLREAVRSGAVKYRAAQEVLPVAVGAAEEYWTRRAATTTVRVLAKEVARLTDRDAEEPWFRVIAAHFLRTHADVANRRPTLSQRVRERDGGFCTVAGCSARADDAHHIEFLSRGGHRTAMWNQTSGCKCHHVCVHELGLRVSGEAPDGLVWTLDGERFTGM